METHLKDGSMTKKIFIFSIFFLLLAVAATAGDTNQTTSPTFTFGTMQENHDLSGEPGTNVTVNMYFFIDSAYGNRNAHITINPSNVPEGWATNFVPAMHTVTLNISGIIITNNENVNVEPRPLLAMPPTISEEDIYYLKSPSGKGYLQAKRVQMIVSIPSNASLGQTYDVSATASASWFGDNGAIALTQSRDFNYRIFVVNTKYSEEVVKTTTLNSTKSNETNQNPQVQETLFNQTNITIILGVIIIGLLGYIALRKTQPSMNTPISEGSASNIPVSTPVPSTEAATPEPEATIEIEAPKEKKPKKKKGKKKQKKTQENNQTVQ